MMRRLLDTLSAIENQQKYKYNQHQWQYVLQAVQQSTTKITHVKITFYTLQGPLGLERYQESHPISNTQ